MYSDQRPILNPAELAEMEVLLGSKSGIEAHCCAADHVVYCMLVFFCVFLALSLL